MRMKLVLVCTLVAVLLGLVACNTRTATLEITCDDFTEYQHFTWEVRVNRGDSVVVTLCSNPTTGYRWSESAQVSDVAVLRQTDHEYDPAEDKNIVGGAGKEVWTFKALDPGTTTVSMEYSRSGEGDEKGHWTFIATITVE